MERNSTIGYILILGLFAGFWYFNKDNQQLLEEKNGDKTEVVDSTTRAGNTSPASDEYIASYVPDTSSVNLVSENITLLQNELISIDFTDRGGVPKKVTLKNFQRYDSSALVLFEGNEMELGFTFPLASGIVVNTRDKNFTTVTNNEDEVVYTLALDNGAYIKQTYTLAPNSYKVDYKVQFDGMPSILAPNNRFATLDWKTKLQGQSSNYCLF
jgi:YidC/Oxa1 family membrane protein insertase